EIGKAWTANSDFLKLYNPVKKDYDAIATKVLAKGGVAGMALAVNDVNNIVANVYVKTDEAYKDVKITVGGQPVNALQDKEKNLVTETVKLNEKDTAECNVYQVVISPKDYEKAIEVKNGTDAPVESYSVKDYLDHAETYLAENADAKNLAVALADYCKSVKTYLAESASKQKSYPYYNGSVTAQQYKGSALVITDEARVELRNYYDVNGAIRYKVVEQNTEDKSYVLGSLASLTFTTNANSTVQKYADKLKEKYGEDSSTYKVVSALLEYDNLCKKNS
ncbi:MAG: hypothetical protein K2H26_01660, partial [Ruminococcus sp.]|nr:hypothetical protein [Ruminococcus sp.]